MAFSLCFLLNIIAYAQETDHISNYNEQVVANPNADADINLFSDFTHALTDNEMDKAKGLMDPAAISYGPSANDSANVDQFIEAFERDNQGQQNRKIDYVSATFHVNQGPQMGNWVMQWGTYSFTDSATSKTVEIPYHWVAKVADGKIGNNYIYYDVYNVMKELGYTITPPKSESNDNQ